MSDRHPCFTGWKCEVVREQGIPSADNAQTGIRASLSGNVKSLGSKAYLVLTMLRQDLLHWGKCEVVREQGIPSADNAQTGIHASLKCSDRYPCFTGWKCEVVREQGIPSADNAQTGIHASLSGNVKSLGSKAYLVLTMLRQVSVLHWAEM
ncbi:hypothetical protein J6590_021530 [Homalodisca vitripennis]|nr:hypothetical protein J6590_021530 [Homalodisca vitripennis]